MCVVGAKLAHATVHVLVGMCVSHMQTLDERERLRLDRLQRQFNVPRRYRESLAQQDSRRARAEMIQRMKEERAAQAERVSAHTHKHLQV